MSSKIGSDSQIAREALQQGKLVAIPTETVYGLAANAYDEKAVTGIFLAKNRPSFNPLILHVYDVDQAQSFTGEWPQAAVKLAKTFWPGPLTLLLPRDATIVPDLVTAGSPLVAVRVPAHPVTRELLKMLDFPLAAPSANPSGYISPTTAQHVHQQLGDKVSYILEGGQATVGIESTIIGFDQDGNPLLYRLGGLSLSSIEDCVGPLRTARDEHHKPATPGRLARHYAPETAFILGSREALQQRKIDISEKVAILAFEKPWPNIPNEHQRVLSLTGDTAEAARNLFRMMRELDALGLSLILAEEAPQEGLGPAINDRLFRASYDTREM
ncbi:MAG: L-threonylcarbamoyladenylate synthase [Bacteroidia bacterium]